MTSPINNSNINRSTTDSAASSTARSRNKAAADVPDNNTARPAAQDTVSLSAESLQVGELRQQLNELPEVDAEKVAAIKQEIARGNYPLDPERIAENLMSLEKALTE
jgi:negative regulator of flagellin synthesis FlgM